MFRQPNLATTLRTIVAAEQSASEHGADRDGAIHAGRDAFYKGEIAQRIVAANRAASGVFTGEDLAEFQGQLETSASTRFSGYDVHKAGPWNQGPYCCKR
jgi:gamma-glutamyltranspeptidase/glutathione hydrolase